MKKSFRQAYREAIGVVLASFAIAAAYNLFATTRVPWIREIPHGETVSYDSLFGKSTTAASDTGRTSAQSAAVNSFIDTATPKVTGIDTAGMSDKQRKAQAQHDSLARNAVARKMQQD